MASRKRYHVYGDCMEKSEYSRVGSSLSTQSVHSRSFHRRPVIVGEHEGRAIRSEQTAPNARISSVQFQLASPDDIKAVSHVNAVRKELYDPNCREPIPFGLLDRKLGVCDKVKCATCNLGVHECMGHFGHIDLELPVVHIGYFKYVLRILECICINCSRVRIDAAARQRVLMLLQRAGNDRRMRSQIISKNVHAVCKKSVVCPFCSQFNPGVKKIPKLFRYRLNWDTRRGAALHREHSMSQFGAAARCKPGLLKNLSALSEEISPVVIDRLFRRIPLRDLVFLDMRDLNVSRSSELGLSGSAGSLHRRVTGSGVSDVRAWSRPEHLLIHTVPVPPVCIRPSVDMGPAGSNEDDLTVKLRDILQINTRLADTLRDGGAPSMVAEHWEFLQHQVAMYINSDLPGYQKAPKTIRSLAQRLKGKTGRFRGNLSGKRVNFTARTVISPDPNLRIDEVGVPIYICMRLTFPERVTASNIARLRRVVRRGKRAWPGANEITDRSGTEFRLFTQRSAALRADKLRIGDTVHRHLIDGDVVLFNRQPSLHRVSIMAHRVRVLQGRTLRFNICVCNPYNADFDGDEMNMHVPQTQEARAEALELMATTRNIQTPRHGAPLICAIQDIITGAFLLSARDVFLSKNQFMQLVAYIHCTPLGGVRGEYDFHGYAGGASNFGRLRIPPPAVWKPAQLWTGKQVMTALLQYAIEPFMEQADAGKLFCNVEGRAYSGAQRHICQRDGFITIFANELVCGRLGKGVLGGSKAGIVYRLLHQYGWVGAARFLNGLTRLIGRYLGNRGFSIGLDDVTPSPALNRQKGTLVRSGGQFCSDKIQQYRMGTLRAQTGFTEAETLEDLLLGRLSSIRSSLGAFCLHNLDLRYNSPLVMAVSGSKGSNINISQMVACVGQQAIGGKRIGDGFLARSLPHFAWGDRSAHARGFVENSFYSGLTPTEFFFHTCAGREGLVDTAVKTAETGYMQRRLIKTLEDMHVSYDGTVRDERSGVAQFVYGEDQLDPIYMARGVSPVDFEHEWYCVTMETCEHPLLGAQLGATAPSHPLARFAGRLLTGLELRDAVGVMLDALHDPDRLTEHGPTCEGWRAHLGKLVRSAGAVPRFSPLFLQRLRGFVARKVHDISVYDRKHQLDARVVAAWDGWSTQSSSAGHQVALTLRAQLFPYTLRFAVLFVNRCVRLFARSLVEPGSAVGAVAAQSIGEPGTQMTLKTFHFAGVASMNVTLGVPRIKEIIDASPSIRTPIITAHFIPGVSRSQDMCRLIKARVERTKLEEVCLWMNRVCSADDCFVEVKVDLRGLKEMNLPLDAITIAHAIRASKKPKVKAPVVVDGEDLIRIYPPSYYAQLYGGSVVTQSAAVSKGQALLGGLGASREARSWSSCAFGVRVRTTRAGSRKMGTVGAGAPLMQELHAIELAVPEVIVGGLPKVKKALLNVILRKETKAAPPASKPPAQASTAPSSDATGVSSSSPASVAPKVERKQSARRKSSRVKGKPTAIKQEPGAPAPMEDQESGTGKAVLGKGKSKGSSADAFASDKTTDKTTDTSAASGDTSKADESSSGDGGSSSSSGGLAPNQEYNLLVESDDFLGVMGTIGIDWTKTTCNHILEVERVLGLEAARGCIIQEIRDTMENHGLSVDQRHLSLLADVMTYRGCVLGITRFGLEKIKQSVLSLASFEKTTDHLFHATYLGAEDEIKGVSESIILGCPIRLGTGSFDLLSASAQRPAQGAPSVVFGELPTESLLDAV